MKINLGDEARDMVTGFKGVCVARTEWLNGCARVTLQPKMGKDGKHPDAVSFDEPQLKLIKAKKVVTEDMKRAEKGEPRTGGWKPEPMRGK